MKSAGRQAAATVERNRPEGAPFEGDAQIVAIRPQVVDNVGHVLGNLFQRIYHLIEQARRTDPPAADGLVSSTRQLEDFLQLVMDYFSPISLDLQDVEGAEVAQSLARQISGRSGCRVQVEAKLSEGSRLRVDPGRLAQAFGLLALRIRKDSAGEEGIELKAVARASSRAAVLAVVVPRHLVSMRTSESEMDWAVAEKFLELHGGSLRENPAPSGELLWEIVLPLQR